MEKGVEARGIIICLKKVILRDIILYLELVIDNKVCAKFLKEQVVRFSGK